MDSLSSSHCATRRTSRPARQPHPPERRHLVKLRRLDHTGILRIEDALRGSFENPVKKTALDDPDQVLDPQLRAVPATQACRHRLLIEDRHPLVRQQAAGQFSFSPVRRRSRYG
jgi:hypothetical protein